MRTFLCRRGLPVTGSERGGAVWLKLRLRRQPDGGSLESLRVVWTLGDRNQQPPRVRTEPERACSQKQPVVMVTPGADRKADAARNEPLSRPLFRLAQKVLCGCVAVWPNEATERRITAQLAAKCNYQTRECWSDGAHGSHLLWPRWPSEPLVSGIPPCVNGSAGRDESVAAPALVLVPR